MTKTATDNPASTAAVNDFAELKKKSLTGIGSLLGRQFLVYGIMFVGNIILARILLPRTFGIYAIVTFVVQFFSTFSDVGIGAALIQKKEELTNEELSTLFWLQQLLTLAVVVAAYITAPLALRVYPSLPPVTVWLIRGMAITFLFSSFKTVPAILMERVLDFRRIAVVDIAETLVFQAAAIAFALANFDVWSFIIAALLRGVLGAGLIYMISPWRPSFRYRLASVHGLIRFGLPYQGNTILSFIKDAITPLFVGAYAGASAVGYINWARNLAFAPLFLSQSFGRVAFPSFSRLQHERILLKGTIERSIRMMTFVIFPITAIMFALAPEIIRIVFTQKWMPGILAFYFYCTSPYVIGIMMPLYSGIMAIGRSAILLKLAILLLFLEWGMGVPFVIAFGFNGIAFSQPILACVFLIVYKRILDAEGVRVEIIKNVLHQCAASVIIGIGMRIIVSAVPVNLLTLVALSIGGCLLFLILMHFIKKSLVLEFRTYALEVFRVI
jgi:O-antigen/teichoic acid export membrane protein